MRWKMCITSSYSELPSMIQQGRRIRREKSNLISLLPGKMRINKKSVEIWNIQLARNEKLNHINHKLVK